MGKGAQFGIQHIARAPVDAAMADEGGRALARDFDQPCSHVDPGHFRAPAGGREDVLDRLQRPEGPLFAYLAEEVVAAASPEIRATLAEIREMIGVTSLAAARQLADADTAAAQTPRIVIPDRDDRFDTVEPSGPVE